MHIALTQTTRRAAYGLLAAALLAAAIAAVIAHGSGWWIFTAFIVAPDLAVLLGISPGLEKGRLHPRAIPLYNALHSLIGPCAARTRGDRARARRPDRRARLGAPHLLRPLHRLRDAHARWLPALLTASRHAPGRSWRRRARSSRRRDSMRSRCAASPSASGSARRRSTSTSPTRSRSRRRSSRPPSRSRPACSSERSREGDDPLEALGAAYRRFALAHPHLYRLMTDRELRRDLLAPGVEERAGLHDLSRRRRGHRPRARRVGLRPRHGNARAHQPLPAGSRHRRRLARGHPRVPQWLTAGMRSSSARAPTAWRLRSRSPRQGAPCSCSRPRTRSAAACAAPSSRCPGSVTTSARQSTPSRSPRRSCVACRCGSTGSSSPIPRSRSRIRSTTARQWRCIAPWTRRPRASEPTAMPIARCCNRSSTTWTCCSRICSAPCASHATPAPTCASRARGCARPRASPARASRARAPAPCWPATPRTPCARSGPRPRRASGSR